ncbi:CD276 antigen homolog [Scyliorhinus canicula]|uniref:CD276 antigen homolog n=1 Tax=Scyliorhinus canicula TaxID=7830 RepID=UPI0018F3644B|nr:CD276 antigen homolog [Scyliorhinus canicula]
MIHTSASLSRGIILEVTSTQTLHTCWLVMSEEGGTVREERGKVQDDCSVSVLYVQDSSGGDRWDNLVHISVAPEQSEWLSHFTPARSGNNPSALYPPEDFKDQPKVCHSSLEFTLILLRVPAILSRMKSWIIGLHLAVFCVAAVTGWPSVVGIIGERVLLPCSYTVNRGTDLHVLWQTEKDQLVHAQLGDREYSKTQEYRYRNRTRLTVEKMTRGDLSLELDAVNLADQGMYNCIVLEAQPNDGNRMKQNTKVNLITAAHYSTPLISGPRQESIQEGKEVKLTCTSSSGYPEPTVNWMDGGGNLLPLGSQVNTTVQSDPASGLWNVTSVLRVNVTINCTFLCSIFNRSTRETKSSLHWKYSSIPNHLSFNGYTLILVLMGLGLTVTLGLLLYKRRRSNKCSGTDKTDNCLNCVSSESKSIEMEKMNQNKNCV